MASISWFCLILLFVCVFSYPYSLEWETFTRYVRDYKKPYFNDSAIMKSKFKAFQESLWRHVRLNTYESQNGGQAKYGVNKFSDLTQEEFKSHCLSPFQQVTQSNVRMSSTPVPSNVSSYFDWRDKNVITAIRNQEKCGSCWAFSVAEVLESKLSIDTGQPPIELSVQQIISCEDRPDYSLYGCKGGNLFNAFEAIKKDSMVIVPSSVYPFESGDGQTKVCQKNLPDKGVQLKEYINHSNMEENQMIQYVYSVGPTSNSVDAAMWQDYIGGIIQHHCTDYIDHAVQIVGYNMTGPVPYWIVRNTWGSDWGENGYVRLKYGVNTCGIADEVVIVTDVSSVNL